jgi:hypothetical protein
MKPVGVGVGADVGAAAELGVGPFGGEGAVEPSGLFASLPGETHEEWDYGDAPDPHELLEIAKLNQLEFLFLDIGRPTHNGWVHPDTWIIRSRATTRHLARPAGRPILGQLLPRARPVPRLATPLVT